MIRFLRFVVEAALAGRQEQLKEYLVGVEVFDRNHDYDPHLDPIVRVDARRLRAKLKEYYENGGQRDALVISLPKGSYAPLFEYREMETAKTYPLRRGEQRRRPVERRERETTAKGVEPSTAIPKRPQRSSLLVLAFAFACLGLLSIVWLSWPQMYPAKPSRSSLTLLASESSGMGRPAFSPDGKMLTYSSGSGEKDPRGIYIMELAGKSTRRLTNTPAIDVAPSFAPDGTRIVFRRNGQGLFLTSILGGDERKLSDYGSNPRWSPDGRQIVFNTGDSDILRSKLFLIPAEGGQPKQYQPHFDAAWLPHWSADGTHILFAGCRALQKDEWDFWVAPVSEGPPIRTGIWEACQRAGLHDPRPGAWASGGTEVFFWAYQGDTTNVWKIGLSPTFQAIGEPVKVSSGAGEECCPSVTIDGRVAYKTVFRENRIVAVAELGPPGEKVEEEINHGSYHDVSPSVSADGKGFRRRARQLVGRTIEEPGKQFRTFSGDKTSLPGIPRPSHAARWL